MLTCLLTGVLAATQVYAAQLVWPRHEGFPDVDTAFVFIAGQLRGFAKLAIDPGETKTCTFRLTADDLALYDKNLRRVVEPGQFRVMVGSSSEDIRLTDQFEVK